jgi:hypothetical protein
LIFATKAQKHEETLDADEHGINTDFLDADFAEGAEGFGRDVFSTKLVLPLRDA